MSILTHFDIQFTSDIPDHLKCPICRGILIDSCCCPCGCKFCFACIKNYLNNEEKCCPRKKDECRHVILKLSKNIIRDDSDLLEISDLMVRCPFMNCFHQCHLKQLIEHLCDCTKAPIKCVFSLVGCNCPQLMPENIDDHFNTNGLIHSKMLMSYLKKLNSEVDLRMNDINYRMNKLIDDNEQFTIRIQQDVVDINTEQGKLNNFKELTYQEFENLWQENIDLQGKLRKNKDELSLLVNEEIESEKRLSEISGSIKLLEESILEMKQSFLRFSAEMQQEVNEIKKFQINLKESIEESRSIAASSGDDSHGKQDQFTESKIDLTKNEQFDMEVNTYPRRVDLVESEQVHDFTWRIDKVSLKYHNNKDDYSKSFWSDGHSGYKMCLYFWIAKPGWLQYGGLDLTFRLMNSSCDDDLEWPMKRTVQLDLLNQNNGLPLLSQKVCYWTTGDRRWAFARRAAYSRPKANRNRYGDGILRFSKYDDLQTLPGLIKDDCIVVRCRVYL